MNKRATALSELLAPLSTGKAMLVLELLRPDLLDQLEHCLVFIKELEIPVTSTQNTLDDFLLKRYMVLEDSLSCIQDGTFTAAIRFLEQPKYKNIIQAYSFVDGIPFIP
ncbi:hypothetical protein HA075_00450 [bacterium BFN5]|nr:hypothetical protein HA075_00165 [bacterium BFN5]QJW44439.1 hypothetical protein HA075_00450 [bacterium BFN5]